jgi:hypothetical protein
MLSLLEYSCVLSCSFSSCYAICVLFQKHYQVIVEEGVAVEEGVGEEVC